MIICKKTWLTAHTCLASFCPCSGLSFYIFVLYIYISYIIHYCKNLFLQATFQLEEQATNFVNPVYDTMFADEDDLLDSSGSGPILRVPVSPLGENIGGGKIQRTLTN